MTSRITLKDGKVSALPRQEEGVANVAQTYEPSDGELMTALAQKDFTSLGWLYRRHQASVRNLLLRIDPDRSQADADDLCQEVFLTLYETAPRYYGGDRLRPWLFGIALHKARRFRQKWRLRRWLLWQRFTQRAKRHSFGADPQIMPDTALAQRQRVALAFAALKPQQREILALHVGENLSGEELAALLGVAVKTVWTRLHRAREALQKALGEDL